MDWCATKPCAPAIDSATRLVMADSTNLSLGPNATLKLDRTVFDDEHHYRDVAVRMTSGAFRFVTGHSDKAAYKITTPLATIGVRGTTLDILSQRGQTIVNLQDGAASVCTSRLNASSSPSPATPPSSPRAAAADRRSRRPTIRPGRLPQPAAPQQGFAARRNMRMRPPSSSMTAAIPPACCAGADHGKLRPQRRFVGNALRSRLLAMQSSPAWAQSPSPSPTPLDECVECYPPTPTPSPSPDANAVGFADSDAKPDIDATHQRADHAPS